jgi:archaellum component FlaC
MGIFDKKEKKLRKEFSKKNTAFCRDAVKELEELHDELKTAYDAIETVVTEFAQFKEEVSGKLETDDTAKMETFLKRFKKVDKVARDAVRDVHDLLRGQKKRLREALNDE